VFLIAALGLILLGTLYPLFMDALELGKISVGPPYFELVFLVPMLPLLALIGVGMHAAWKRGLLGSARNRLLIIAGSAFAAALIIGAAAYGEIRPWHCGSWQRRSRFRSPGCAPACPYRAPFSAWSSPISASA
jgi:cytochrome c-type biogenesis protein CcmF